MDSNSNFLNQQNSNQNSGTKDAQKADDQSAQVSTFSNQPIVPPEPQQNNDNSIPGPSLQPNGETPLVNQSSSQNIGVGHPEIGIEPEITPDQNATNSSTINVSSNPIIPDVPKPPSAPTMPTPPTDTFNPPFKPPVSESQTSNPEPRDQDIPNSTQTDPVPTNTQQQNTVTPQMQDIPVKHYDSRVNQPASVPNQSPPVTPVFQTPQQENVPQAPIKTNSSVGTILLLIVIALIIGSGGGIYGAKTIDKLKTSASTTATPTPASPSSTLQESLGESSSTVNLKTYSNSKYNFSLKYLGDWQTSTINPTADSIVFASDENSLTNDSEGFRIEIDFQNSNGKTLKSWVSANSVAIKEKNTPKEITVSGETAYQQVLSNAKSAIATYIERPDKIMIVTYSAAPEKMGEGGSYYNDLINSIKLN